MTLIPTRSPHPVIGAALTGLLTLAPWSSPWAARNIEDKRDVDPLGSVEIVALAGTVEVSGWNRSVVEVTGTADGDFERVEVTTAGDRTTIRAGHGAGEVHLVIHVPERSALSTRLVSADLIVKGLRGEVQLHSMSGNIDGAVAGDLHANTVSGHIRLAAREARILDLRTISGGIVLDGGGGDVDVSTVSGDARLQVGTISRGRFKTVSGDVSLNLTLGPDAQLEGESVSGTVRLAFASAPSGSVDVQSFSGKIDNCFGPKPSEARYGPGSNLVFKAGEGHSRVHVETNSADVHLCTGGAAPQPSASAISDCRRPAIGLLI